MKTKLLILFTAVTLIICGCSNDEPKITGPEKAAYNNGLKSKEEAIKIAIDHMSQRNMSRSSEYKVANVEVMEVMAG